MTEPASDAKTYAPALKLAPWVWYSVYAVARALVGLRFRVRIRSAAETPRGPVLLAVKHVSAWDIPIGTYVTRRVLQKRKPYFQMGSFIGYPVFGRLIPAMQACGGFTVMRPKEVLRLRKSAEHDRADIRRMMDEVNGVAEATRRAVLTGGGVIVVFPEGTRDATAVNPVRSHHEIESALAVGAAAEAAARPVILPATFSYGRKRPFRRTPVDVVVAPPIAIEGRSATELAAAIEDVFRRDWRPPPTG